MKRKVIVLLLVVIMVSAVGSTASAEGLNISLSGIHDTYMVVHTTKVISIFSGILHENGNDSDIYYITCQGLDFTETDLSQPRSVASAVKIGLSNENNAYVQAVCDAVNTYVPKNSKLIFVGHSLGGMVVEQAIANKQLKTDYDILHTMAIGSPYIITKGTKEGTLIRLADTMDVVPYLSIPFLANPYLGDVAKESSHMGPLVHFLSYQFGHCWDKYDAIGVKGGSTSIDLTGTVVRITK